MATQTTLSASLPGSSSEPAHGVRSHYAKFLRDPVGFLTRVYREHGDIVILPQDHSCMAFAFGPDHNRFILSNPDVFHSTGLTVAGASGTAQRRVGYGLFSVNTHRNRQMRRTMMPPLHKMAVESYRDKMVAIVHRLIGTWQACQRMDLFEQMRILSLRVSIGLLFGLDADHDERSIGFRIEKWMNLNSSLAVRFSSKNRPSEAYRRMARLAGEIEQDMLRLIQQKRSTLDSSHDVLSILIRACDDGLLNESELVGQATILLAAADETTADTLNWTLFLLAQHPRVMADVLDELTANLRGEPPTVAQLNQLPMLDRVIKESMRILPAIIYNTRTNVTPVDLGPHTLPKGTTILYSHYITHRIPDLYPQPARFLPERWETIRPSPYAYLPFGAGPRMCIGAAFATQTIKIALSMILQRYRIQVVPGSRIDRFVRITLTPRFGMPMLIAPQDRCFSRSPVCGNIHEMVDFQ